MLTLDRFNTFAFDLCDIFSFTDLLSTVCPLGTFSASYISYNFLLKDVLFVRKGNTYYGLNSKEFCECYRKCWTMYIGLVWKEEQLCSTFNSIKYLLY